MPTELMYLQDTELCSAEAKVVEAISVADGRTLVVLDRTIFHPQGGGQPTDVGTICTEGGSVAVDRVSFVDGVVRHEGTQVEGVVAEGDLATLEIDFARRWEHARLHTGGHLVMTTIDTLAGLPAVKGYHFPNGPYVEFEGMVEAPRQAGLADDVQRELDRLIAENSAVTARFATVEELLAEDVHVPALPAAGKRTRVVVTAGYHSPCGGTHVPALGALIGLRVKGIKTKSGRTRVSYMFVED